MSLIGVICSPFFWEGLVSLEVWFSGSVLSFSSDGFGCFSISVVVTGVVDGAVVLVSVGCLAAAGANGLLTTLPACGFWLCVWGWPDLDPCWVVGLWRGLCWLIGVWCRGEPVGWCLGDGWGTGSGGSSRPSPDISRCVWQLRHNHSFFWNREKTKRQTCNLFCV